MSELPEGWAEATLGEIASVQLGKMLDREKRIRGVPLPYLRNANVRWGAFDLSDLLQMPFEDHELDRFDVRRGDLFICEGGEPGRCAVWTESDRADLKFQKAVLRVRPGRGVDSRWLMYALQLCALNGDLSSYFTGSTIRHFPREAVVRFAFPLPPPSEQRRIMQKVETLLARTAAANDILTKAANLLHRSRLSVLDAAYDGSLIGARIAEHVRFGDICVELRGGNSSTSIRNATKWPVLKSSAVRPFEIDYEDMNFLTARNHWSGGSEVREGDLLITRLSGSVEYVGNCALVKDQPPRPLQIPDRIFRARINEEFDPRYLEIMFNAPRARKPLEEAAKSSAGHQRISLSDIREVAIPRISRDQQLALVCQFGSVIRSIRAAEERLGVAKKHSESTRGSILAKAFAGELVPTEAELARRDRRMYEPAAVLLDRIRGEHEQPFAAQRGRTGARARARATRLST